MGKSLTKQSEASTGVVKMATCDSLVLEKRDYNEAWHSEEDSTPSEFCISLDLTSNVDRLQISMSWTDQVCHGQSPYTISYFFNKCWIDKFT